MICTTTITTTTNNNNNNNNNEIDLREAGERPVERSCRAVTNLYVPYNAALATQLANQLQALCLFVCLFVCLLVGCERYK
jgi:hypothetical protein